MDIQQYIFNLRGQNEHLGQLSDEIETELQELEALFGQHHGQRHDPQGLQAVAQLHRCLCVEAETFCKRLQLLLEEVRQATATLPLQATT